LLVAFAGLLVAALGVGFLVSQLGDQGAASDVAGRTSATPPAKTPATGSAKTSEQAAPTAATDAKAGKSLESFVKSYYSEVTKNTDRTWAQLSPTMQGAAGGRNGYDGFWRTIDKVRVNQTQSSASDTQAVVSLTFTRNDGTTSTETHRFTFVTASGDYLIESDKNLG